MEKVIGTMDPIYEHLMKMPTNSITISQGSKRKRRSGVTSDKFRFTIKDIANELVNPEFSQIYANAPKASDKEVVESFIRALPKFGFKDGTHVDLNMLNGSSKKIVNRDPIELKFKEESKVMVPPATTSQIDMFSKQQPNTLPGMATTPVHQAMPINHMESTMMGMAARYKAESKAEALQEKYTFQLEQNNKLKEDLADECSKRRMLEEENHALKLKVNTSDMEKELAIKSVQIEKSNFLDSPGGQKVMEAAPSLIAAIMQQQNATAQVATGMGVPDNTSEVKKYLIEGVLQPAITDDLVEIATQVLQAVATDQDFRAQITQLLNTEKMKVVNG